MPKINHYDENLNLVIAENIRDRRKELHFTCKDIADKIGICTEQYRKYETGQSRVSADYLFLLSNILDVNITYFLNGYTGTSNESESFKEIKKELIPLNVAFSKIENEELRKSVLDFVNNISRNQSN